MEKSKMNVVIVGGSVAGLMSGVILKRFGHNATILESRKLDELESQAAGLGLGPYAQELMRTIVPSIDDIAISRPTFQFISMDGTVVSEQRATVDLATSSWSLVSELLRKEFESGQGEGKTEYRVGLKAKNLRKSEDGVVVTVQNVTDGSEEDITADLVIVASGAVSSIRKIFDRKEAEYAGFLLWRGTISEHQMPKALEGCLDKKFCFSMVKDSYCLGYLAPNKDGRLDPGTRSFEFGWYDYCEGDSPEFRRIMTDSTGRQHLRTIPRGKMQPEVWKERIARAHEILPKPWAEVAEKADPLVAAITSYEDPKAVYWDDRVLFVGDAYTQFRPHLGLGANLAAFQALRLGDVLKGELTLAQWEEAVRAYATEYAAHSKAMGVFGLTGKWPEGYKPLAS